MTKEQFLDIKNQLESWREERGITILSQRENFYVNYTEELWEFFKGVRNKNEHEIIDSLCDMFVIGVNAGFDYEDKEVDYFVRAKEIRSPHYLLTEPFFSKRVDGVVIEFILRGYDPYKCLLETIKELNSRTGAWSESEGKWLKNAGAYDLRTAELLASEIVRKRRMRDVSGDISLIEETDKYWHFAFELWGARTEYQIITKWHKADYTHCRKGIYR